MISNTEGRRSIQVSKRTSHIREAEEAGRSSLKKKKLTLAKVSSHCPLSLQEKT